MSATLVAEPDTDDADRLTLLARESAATGTPRRVLLLRLGALPSDHGKPHHRRLAQEALQPLLEADRARLFRLPDGSLAVVWRGSAAFALSAVRAALHLLFDGIPLAPGAGGLIELIELPDQADRLIEAVAATPEIPAPPPAPPAGERLDAETLAALEAALAQANMARFVRRAPICRIGAEGPVAAWEHRHLALTELGETMLPGRDLRADPWLLRRLGRTLERRMLALLTAPDELRDAAPFGLDITVSGILSPDFLRFDAALPSRLRGRLVLHLQPADLLADPAAFIFARDFSRARGWRLLLGGLDPAGLALFPPSRLGFDWVEWRFSPALAGHSVADPERVVLAGADAAALAWGAAQGIKLFRGPAAVPKR